MDRQQLLAQIPIFESLEPADVEALTAQLDALRFDEDATVFAAGDSGSSLFIVEEGEVSIELPQAKGPPVVLATLHTGRYFGEMSLLDGQPRSAAARATKPTTLLRLERQDLVDLIRRRPDASIRILAELGERLRQTNEMLSQRVSKNVNEVSAQQQSFGDRLADRIAEIGGSWPFVIGFFIVLFGWMATNIVLGRRAFDEFPFIFLNLMLSVTAAIQAPIIMMSQNRSGEKDRIAARVDFEVNLKNEIGIERLQKSLDEVNARLTLLDRYVTSATGRTAGQPGV
jgi:uncharacterized membrane protein